MATLNKKALIKLMTATVETAKQVNPNPEAYGPMAAVLIQKALDAKWNSDSIHAALMEEG